MAVTRAYGDNFITAKCLPKMPDEEIQKTFDWLIPYFYQRVRDEYEDISVTVSMGINVIKENANDIVAELDNANFARQIAQKKMKNTVIFHEEIMQERLRKAKFVNEFEQALVNNEFKVYYQPKVDSKTQNIVGGEALIRWVKDDGTVIPPSDFIDMFEKCGHIVKLDYYVYEHVFKYISERLEAGKYTVPISMNVSRIHLKEDDSDDIITYIKKLIEKYKVPSKYLEFEITENVCMSQLESTMQFIKEMQELDIKVSIDDFGSGYSSLSVLSEVNADIIKVDKEFFDNWDKSSKKQIIIDSILDMAKKLDMSVVCEGVEHLEQSEYLATAGCEILQGFYFSKPIEEEKFNDYINEHQEIHKQ